MVALVLRLRLALLANAFRRSPWQVLGIVAGGVYGILVTVLAVGALAGLRDADVGSARDVVVAGGSLVVLGALLVPPVLGSEDALDPRRFAPYGIEPRRLALALGVAALVSAPGVVLVVVAMTTVVTWSRDPVTGAVAVVAGLAAVVTCILVARISTVLAGVLLSTRRAREATGLAAGLVAVLLVPAVVALAQADLLDDGLQPARGALGVLAWTPIGAAWAAPAAAVAGDAGAAAGMLLVALLSAALLALAWVRLVPWALTAPDRAGGGRAQSGLGWFGRFGASPTGAVAARSVTYWIRDPRYRATLVLIPVLPLVLLVPLVIVDVDAHVLALVPLPVMALFLGWSVHNDTAHDHTAVWLHVVSGIRGTADRIGRIVPVLAIGVPLIAIGAPLSALGFGDSSVLPSVIGVSAGVLLIGVGLSSLFSARFPYPASRPGDSPFHAPQTSGAGGSTVPTLTFIATVVLALPSAWLGGLGLAHGGAYPAWSLVVGLGIGVVTLVAGVAGGGRVFERRGPELLAFAQRH
ncbi:ABC transporter permease [Clavibacter michiganensis]|uniref:ABC transporter permease n=1 Tax=Clavibacter michiganensis TaxID=28447 RepID=UPI000CE84987|nr:ABC transporter permease [Clavibacter michiganensis]PPF53527.1 ABC transporter permease [Clavibacter michiganensis]